MTLHSLYYITYICFISFKAKTQKMKHSIPKGDKKKKKEVTAEITQLLADMDLRHENEIKEFVSFYFYVISFFYLYK